MCLVGLGYFKNNMITACYQYEDPDSVYNFVKTNLFKNSNNIKDILKFGDLPDLDLRQSWKFEIFELKPNKNWTDIDVLFYYDESAKTWFVSEKGIILPFDSYKTDNLTFLETKSKFSSFTKISTAEEHNDFLKFIQDSWEKDLNHISFEVYSKTLNGFFDYGDIEIIFKSQRKYLVKVVEDMEYDESGFEILTYNITIIFEDFYNDNL